MLIRSTSTGSASTLERSTRNKRLPPLESGSEYGLGTTSLPRFLTGHTQIYESLPGKMHGLRWAASKTSPVEYKIQRADKLRRAQRYKDKQQQIFRRHNKVEDRLCAFHSTKHMERQPHALKKQLHDQSDVMAALQVDRWLRRARAPSVALLQARQAEAVVVLQSWARQLSALQTCRVVYLLRIQGIWRICLAKKRAKYLQSIKDHEAAKVAAAAEKVTQRKRKYREERRWLRQRARRALAFQARKQTALSELRALGQKAARSVVVLQSLARGEAARGALWRQEQKRQVAFQWLLHRAKLARTLHRRQEGALLWLKEQGEEAILTVERWSIQLMADEVKRLLGAKNGAATQAQTQARGWLGRRSYWRQKLRHDSGALLKARERLRLVEAALKALEPKQQRERKIAETVRVLHQHSKLNKPKQAIKHLAKLNGSLSVSDHAEVLRLIATAVVDAGWDVNAKKPTPESQARASQAVRMATPPIAGLDGEVERSARERARLNADIAKLDRAVEEAEQNRHCSAKQGPLHRDNSKLRVGKPSKLHRPGSAVG